MFLRNRIFDAFMLLWALSFVGRLGRHAVWLRPSEVRETSRRWARGVLWGLRVFLGVSQSVRGSENRPSGPRLIVANHQSWWETVAFALLEPDVAIVAKRSLAGIPIFGWFMRRYGHILIDREMTVGSVRQIIVEAKRALAEGRSVLIFPEGARRPIGAPFVMKRSIYLIYKELGVSVAPAVHNSGALFRLRWGVQARGRVTVEYLPALPPGLGKSAFIAQLSAVMAEGMTRLGQRPGDDCAER
ncbi:MAG: 1-acyl-sn-glycerol-3-phosphate acyltransferase [Neomegalonema sp.]|nr:1-acyl-sn-glycerol-3-phosphate acyltransferase [Neomegalonema sp.]